VSASAMPEFATYDAAPDGCCLDFSGGCAE